MQGVEFTEENIQRIFGHEAAEDEAPERLKQYFLKSAIFDQVTADVPLRILVGHKGTGKSALFQVARAEDETRKRLTLNIQPNDIVGMAEDTADFLKTIQAWTIGLQVLLARKAIQGLGATEGASITERLAGFSGKLTDFLIQTIQNPKGLTFDPAKKAVSDAFIAHQEIAVYIDDLDRGWQGRKQDITRISALLNAIRDLSNDNRNIRFRVALRTDVYFLVRTSDESTDKVEGSVVWLRWTQREIFALLALRIETFFVDPVDSATFLARSQGYLSTSLDRVFEPHFNGRRHWRGVPMHRVLMSLTRKRPRDLVKLCTLAAREARIAHDRIITTASLERVFEDYSQGRMQDTINEYRTELPEIERLLFGMKPSKKEKTAKAGYTYTTAALLTKIKTIEERGAFRFANGRTATTKELASFLYKINFITARKDVGLVIDRKYFEESRYLQSSFADFGYDWEIHPAYRWALQPDNLEAIFESLKLTQDTFES